MPFHVIAFLQKKFTLFLRYHCPEKLWKKKEDKFFGIAVKRIRPFYTFLNNSEKTPHITMNVGAKSDEGYI